MAQQGRQFRVGDRVTITSINQGFDHTGMALRRVEIEIGDRQLVLPQGRVTDRSVQIQGNQTVKGAFERRTARSQLDWHEQRNEHSQGYHGWLRPEFPRPLDPYESCTSGKMTDNSTESTLAHIEERNSTSSSRNDPVRLSRRAAVKHNSTKDKNTKIEKHDSMVQNTHASETASARAPAVQTPTSTRPSDVRRFSFEFTNRSDATGLPDTPDFEDIPITPVATDLEREPALVSEANNQVRASINASRPQTSVQQQQSHPVTEEERNHEELKELDRVRRRVLTTFDEILGKRKIPTALL